MNRIIILNLQFHNFNSENIQKAHLVERTHWNITATENQILN